MVYLVISNHLTTLLLIILRTKSIILALSIFTAVALPTTFLEELFLRVLVFILMLWFYFYQKKKVKVNKTNVFIKRPKKVCFQVKRDLR